ncbi:hypothetical protein [Streptomyces sp. NPDC058548]|uniref:hypothetical protein n=1 Tax=Streptomyces sp. NPDC058548 TaxID=3346545 RepID=UPI00365E4F5B
MDYGRHLDNPRAVAYYEAALANAAAQDDDRRMATKHLAMSETAIAKPAPRPATPGPPTTPPAAGPTNPA